MIRVLTTGLGPMLRKAIACGLVLIGTAAAGQAGPRDIGIIVTNTLYDSPGIPRADYAERDGAAVRMAFKRVFGVDDNNLHWRQNQTRSNLDALFGPKNEPQLGTLWRLLDRAPPTARVYVYYSGHGAPHVPRDHPPERYLVTKDADMGNLPVTAYALQTLRENLAAIRREKLPQGEVILILEACFTGNDGADKPLRPGTSQTPISFDDDRPEQKAEIVEIAASEARQVAYWDTNARLGLFTNMLLWGLHGEADRTEEGGNGDGKVTFAELKSYLDQGMPRRLRLLDVNASQSAVFATGNVPHDRPVVEGGPRARQDMVPVIANERAACDALPKSSDMAAIDGYLKSCMLCRCRAQLLDRHAALEAEQTECQNVEDKLKTERSAAMLRGHAATTSCIRPKPELDRRAAELDAEARPVAPPVGGETKRTRTVLIRPDMPTAPPGPCGSLAVSLSPSRSAAPLSAAEECSLTPKTVFKECGACPEMVVVPAGAFTMGSPASEPERDNNEGRQHRVTFARAFAVGKFAVTFGEWDACAADGGCNHYRPDDQGWGRDKRPVMNVDWNDANAYVAWLSKKTGKKYRLLSEAEREYVTRAGTTPPFWWGSSISTEQANYNGNFTYGSAPKGEYRRGTVPVGSFQPNLWGLYEVHGNVWDWVEDCWNDTYNGGESRDGSAWITGDCSRRVLRGGSWTNLPKLLRAASRYKYNSVNRSDTIGFRVARTL